jgi:hypothetical protein
VTAIISLGAEKSFAFENFPGFDCIRVDTETSPKKMRFPQQGKRIEIILKFQKQLKRARL